MASAQSGIAVVFGFPGGVAITGVATFGKFFNDSGDFSADHTLDEVRDEDNDVRTFIHSGEMLEANLNFTPRAPTLDPTHADNTKAKAKEALVKPTKGASVVLSNFAWAAANATWSYVGGFRLAFSKAGVATYTMRIRKSPDYDVTTPVP